MREDRLSQGEAGEGEVPSSTVSLESTVDLLRRARNGELTARDALVARYLPALRRFAHGRMPSRARSVFDTDDLVQVTIMRALARLDSFEPRHQGSLLAYLRQIVINQIRDETRRLAKRPPSAELSPDLVDPGVDPLEEAIGAEELARYDQALTRLPPESQEALMLRLEMGCSYQEIAEAIGRPSANAARLMTGRALLQLVEHMRVLGASR